MKGRFLKRGHDRAPENQKNDEQHRPRKSRKIRKKKVDERKFSREHPEGAACPSDLPAEVEPGERTPSSTAGKNARKGAAPRKTHSINVRPKSPPSLEKRTHWLPRRSPKQRAKDQSRAQSMAGSGTVMTGERADGEEERTNCLHFMPSDARLGKNQMSVDKVDARSPKIRREEECEAIAEGVAGLGGLSTLSSISHNKEKV